MSTGSASIVISATPQQVWTAIADVTRMGEWSPECVACRWIGGATTAALGARFEGDNEARVFGRVVKRWTTTSEVTACESGRLFEFVAEGFSTWRYDLEPQGGGTLVTESFWYEAKGVQGLFYDVVLRRSSSMTTGMRKTLERLQIAVEGGT
jgi:Polyketide cyclase / dehydrase and lipid transport